MKISFLIRLIFLSGVGLFSFSNGSDLLTEHSKTEPSSRIESFTFFSNGTPVKGKIFLPAAYKLDKNLPAIFLIDYTEQHFKVAKDEFEKVIEGVALIEGFDALVVSLEDIPDFNAEPKSFKENYEIFKNMANYVDSIYTNNTSRTFMGRGSESGVVLMALFLENTEPPVFNNFIATDPSPLYLTEISKMLENKSLSQNEIKQKLHFSFSTSNDRAKCKQLIKLINEAQFSWLQFESIEYTNSNYLNTYPVSFAEGVKFIFKE